jgi:hypothetical protein
MGWGLHYSKKRKSQCEKEKGGTLASRGRVNVRRNREDLW